MEKVVTIATDKDQPKDLAYWLSRPVEERFAAVEFLRRQAHPDDADHRLRRVFKVTYREPR
jgi:type III secretory pathway lipoprotein EscJ